MPPHACLCLAYLLGAKTEGLQACEKPSLSFRASGRGQKQWLRIFNLQVSFFSVCLEGIQIEFRGKFHFPGAWGMGELGVG